MFIQKLLIELFYIFVEHISKHMESNFAIFMKFIYIYLIIIITDLVDDRDQKRRYGIEVLLNLSIYQPSHGNERIGTLPWSLSLLSRGGVSR